MPRWFRRLRARLRYRHFDRDLGEELDIHRQMAAEQLERAGETSAAAHVLAVRRLGNVTLARESARSIWIRPWLEGTWQDVRYAARTLRKVPGHSVAAILALTLTIGLSTNFVALAEGLLFKPWSVPDADRLLVVNAERTFPKFRAGGMFLTEYHYLRANSRTIDLAAFNTQYVRIGAENNRPIRLVSGNYFAVLRLPILAGRSLIDADDGGDSGAPVVVISQGLWQRLFNGAPAVGSILTLNDAPFTVVGITDANATDSPVDPVPVAWIALSAQKWLDPRAPLDAMRAINMIAGRLATKASRNAAEAEISSLHAAVASVRDHGQTISTILTFGTTASIDRKGADRVTRPFSGLSLIPALLLLLGCANVANLELARGFGSRRELAIRTALGASRYRVIRQLLIDGLLLCSVASGLSVVLAYVVPPAVLVWYDPSWADTGVDLTPNLRVWGFAALASLVTCLGSGLLPAIRVTEHGAKPRYLGSPRTGLRSTLLAIQTGVSVVLLLGAALLARGIQHASGPGLGFNSHVAVERITLPASYDAGQRRLFSTELIDAAQAAGLGPVGAAGNAPYMGSFDANVRSTSSQTLEGVVEHYVSPGYFDVLQIPVRFGRLFGSGSDEAVVNDTMADRLWPGENPIGKPFTYTCPTCGPGQTQATSRVVVGIVADARTEDPDRVSPGFYEPVRTAWTIIVRNDPLVVERLRGLVTKLDPRAATKTESIESAIWQRLHGSMVISSVVTCVSILAIIVATVGTFGVLTYVVSERTREIGLRVALGARARDVVFLMMRRVSVPLVVGVIVGFIVSQALGTLVQHQLFGVSLHDRLAYAIVVVILFVAGGVALSGPLWKALAVDPATTLRHD